MKKLTYILLFGLLACAGTDPEPIVKQVDKGQPGQRTTCWPDAWSLIHDAPNGVLPFATQINYWITPSILTQNHNGLQYTIKIKNLGSRPVILKGTMAPMNYPLGVNQSVSTVKTLSDCNTGSAANFLQILATGGTAGSLTNIVVTLTAVNAPHTLGSPVSNSMVFQ